MFFRVVEYSRPASAPASAPWTVLTTAQCFARLIAKNGGQARASKTKKSKQQVRIAAAVAPSRAYAAAPSPTSAKAAPGLAAPTAVFAPSYAYPHNAYPAMLSPLSIIGHPLLHRHHVYAPAAMLGTNMVVAQVPY